MDWVTATKLCQAGMQRGEFSKEKQSDLSAVASLQIPKPLHSKFQLTFPKGK